MRLTREDAHKVQGHIHLIFAILSKYQDEVEPFDQVDRINAMIHEAEAQLDIR
jgi:hypothetical protein